MPRCYLDLVRIRSTALTLDTLVLLLILMLSFAVILFYLTRFDLYPAGSTGRAP